MDYAVYYVDWVRYSTQPYRSRTQGGRYGKFENAGTMPVGAMMAKDSFMVTGGGKTGPGLLFVMEKMWKGFNDGSGNWWYSMIMPDGTVFGTTGCKGSANVQFCADCHSAGQIRLICTSCPRNIGRPATDPAAQAFDLSDGGTRIPWRRRCVCGR